MTSNALKAYEVQDNYEGRGAVVFATNGAAARREGASELGIEWGDVEYCRRAPHFDHIAPGPVPPLTLIEHGWWFECHHCGRRVAKDEDDDEFGEVSPLPAGKHSVYCSEGCECADHMKQREREEAAEALREVFEAKFPSATVTHVHANGERLEADKSGCYVVTFTFPGGQYAARWDFGDDFCRVPQCDVGAYNAWREAMK